MSTQHESWPRELVAAEGYIELGLHERAAEALDRIPTREQDRSEVLAMRLTLYNATAHWSEARDVAARLLDRQPDHAAWWVGCAYATRRTVGIPQAEQLLRRAAVLHPREGLIFFNLACYCAQTNRLEEARELLRRAFELTPALRHLADRDTDLLPLGGRLT